MGVMKGWRETGREKGRRGRRGRKKGVEYFGTREVGPNPSGICSLRKTAQLRTSCYDSTLVHVATRAHMNGRLE